MIVEVIERLDRGGAEKSVLQLAAWLERQGIATTVLARAGDLSAAGVHASEVAPGPRLRGWASGLTRIHRETPVRGIHAHSLAPLPEVSVWARARGVPVTFTVHGFSRAGIGGVARMIRMFRPRRVIAVSHELQAQLRDHGVDSMVVHNCLPDANPEGKSLQTADVVAGRLVYAARFTGLKRHAFALRAFGALRAAHPGVTLALLGEGPEREAISRLAMDLGLSGCVDMPGHVDPTPHLCRSALVLSTSSVEGLSLAQIEATMWGRPLVVTRTSGSTDLIRQGSSGLVSDAQTPVAFARDLARALRSDLTAWGRAARQVYCESFDQDTVLPRLVAVYSELGWLCD